MSEQCHKLTYLLWGVKMTTCQAHFLDARLYAYRVCTALDNLKIIKEVLGDHLNKNMDNFVYNNLVRFF